MKKGVFIFVVLLIISILFIIFSLLKFQKNNKLEPVSREEVQNITEEEPFESLVVKHQYKDNKHIFVGDLQLPTPCHEFEVKIEDTNDPNIKNINFFTKQNNEQETCAQIVTPKAFRIEYTGPENLEFKAFIDKIPRRLNIFNLAPDVDIDEFELFIKG